MSGKWVIYKEIDGLWTVLQHESGAKAYFSDFKIGDMLIRYGIPRLPQNPFAALAWLINHGLKPSKIEGDMPVGAIPTQANVEPALLAQVRLLDDKSLKG